MSVQDVELVHAYGGAHFTLSFEDAVDTCAWFSENDIAHGKVNLARISEDAFELVAFGEHPEWGRIGVDSDYVSLTVGRQLYQAGIVGVMVLWHGPEDEPTTEEAWKAAEHQQVYGDYDE